jgi:uncharacterized protein (TIGR02145 family)
MKKIFHVLFAIALTASVNSQNYLISFEGSGETTIVESVFVENLTQGTSLTIDENDQLRLVKDVTGISPVWDNKDNMLRIYPNPGKEYSNIEFIAPRAGFIITEVYDIAGKKILQKSNYFEKGTHLMQISGLSSGVYNINLRSIGFNYTGKIVCQSNPSRLAQINYSGQADIPVNATRLKSENAEVRMQYNTGDRLKLTGISGNYSTVVVDVPAKSQSISFNFVMCTDNDGNNYPVVTIGTQTWMAENLKSTAFANGISIPLVEDNSAWDALGPGDMAYCYYQNSSENGDTYGALYSWASAMNGGPSSITNPSGVQGVCPNGWHLPSDAEWTELMDHLGGELVAGGKMKDVGTTLWKSPNTEATNESGFTGLPGGYRSPAGGYFIDLEKYACFWSATLETGSGFVLDRYLVYDDSKLIISSYNQPAGLSVRCVKN